MDFNGGGGTEMDEVVEMYYSRTKILKNNIKLDYATKHFEKKNIFNMLFFSI